MGFIELIKKQIKIDRISVADAILAPVSKLDAVSAETLRDTLAAVTDTETVERLLIAPAHRDGDSVGVMNEPNGIPLAPLSPRWHRLETWPTGRFAATSTCLRRPFYANHIHSLFMLFMDKYSTKSGIISIIL